MQVKIELSLQKLLDPVIRMIELIEVVNFKILERATDKIKFIK